jgi:hypothetical protein
MFIIINLAPLLEERGWSEVYCYRGVRWLIKKKASLSGGLIYFY